MSAGRVYASPRPGPEARPDVVVVGAASRDRVDGDRRGWRLGGSATYCSLALARLGISTGALIGVDEEAADAGELDVLAKAGVRLRRVPLEHGPVFENLEIDGHRAQRWISKSDELPTGDVPAEWRPARTWLLVPVAGEVGEEWARVPPAEARVVVGWQGLLREFATEGWVKRTAPAPSRLLERARLVCASMDDLAAMARLADLRAMAPQATLVLTSGERGGLVSRGTGFARYEAFAAETVDPTGAGDVFLAALVATWLLVGELASSRALRFAAAAAACAVEGPGITRVPTGTDVAARLFPGSALPRGRTR